jgi:hypothetical protein
MSPRADKTGLIQAGEEVGCQVGAVECRGRLDGMFRYYYRAAAQRD